MQGSCGISRPFADEVVLWGFLDEMLPVPWVHRDERVLYHLIRRAGETGTPLEVVAGSAPGWEDPWSRAQRVFVDERDPGYRAWLDDEQGFAIDSFDVQLARLAGVER